MGVPADHQSRDLEEPLEETHDNQENQPPLNIPSDPIKPESYLSARQQNVVAAATWSPLRLQKGQKIRTIEAKQHFQPY